MANKKECEELLRLMAPAMRDILWCALVWNDHNFGYVDLLAKADRAAKALGFDRHGFRKDPVDDANKLFVRIDLALGSQSTSD
jgi:hypothetical protein